MHQDIPPHAEIEGWLHALGVESLREWDVLVFLYRHQTSLVGADHLARLLGYAIDAVVVALDYLESLGFVERSRVSQGARLYQFTMPPTPPRGHAFERLLHLTDHRAGRIALSRHLRQRDQTKEEGGIREEKAKTPTSLSPFSFRLRPFEEGRGKWHQAI